MYKIVFMRHGRSLADDENKHEGRYDSPLTDIGENQAKKTAKKFIELNYRFDKIIASPLVRANKTATIINQHMNTSIIIEPLWMEVDNGEIAGKPIGDLTNREYPVPPKGFNVYDRIANGTGESRAQLYSRAILAIDKLLNMPEGDYLVVAHGAILQSALQYIMRITPTSNWEGNIGFAFCDNGFCEFTYDSGINSWTLQHFDKGYHL